MEELRRLGYRDPYRVLGELFREGFASWKGDKIVVRRLRLPPDVRLATYFSGLM